MLWGLSFDRDIVHTRRRKLMLETADRRSNTMASEAASLALFVLLVLGIPPAFAARLSGQVVAVADGDTITVLDADNHQHRVRIAGIDAPEKRQPYGTKSREHLAALVFRHEVDVEFKKTDLYGRIIGKVLVANVDAGLRQVEAGMAWHYRAYAREQSIADRRAYVAAEASAKAAGRGLWSDESPQPPWEFRHAKALVRSDG
jgi:endonuclease YncB( thermonuclease family)